MNRFIFRYTAIEQTNSLKDDGSGSGCGSDFLMRTSFFYSLKCFWPIKHSHVFLVGSNHDWSGSGQTLVQIPEIPVFFKVRVEYVWAPWTFHISCLEKHYWNRFYFIFIDRYWTITQVIAPGITKIKGKPLERVKNYYDG